MPEPAALGPRRLWRSVIRPLVEDTSDDILCDVDEAVILEGLLATSEGTLNGVGPSAALDALAAAYGDRVVIHHSPSAAWRASGRWRLVVLDATRGFADHVEALRDVLADGREAPPVLIQGLLAPRGPGDPVAAFRDRGWSIVELPSFESVRLVLPSGRRLLDGARLDPILERLQTGQAAVEDSPAAAQASAELDELRARLRSAEGKLAEAEARRERATRREATTQDVVSALRLFNEQARTELASTRTQVEDMRRAVEAANDKAQSAQRRNARLEFAARAVHEDLVRLHRSQSWRIGHWLTRAARVLTFRKPGRTDALSKALGRLEKVIRPDDGRG